MRLYVLLGVDVGLILLATTLGFVLRENFEITQDRFQAFLPYFCATAVTAIVFVSVARLNRSIWRFSSMHDYIRVGVVVTVVGIGAVSLSFAYNRLEGVARSLPILQIIVGIMVLVGARVMHRARHAARQRKREAEALQQASKRSHQLTVLVVGVGRLTEAYIQALAELGMGRVKVAGIVGCAHRHVGRFVGGHPVLGRLEDIEGVINRLEVHGLTIDRIVVAMPFEQIPCEMVERLLLVEQSRGIPLQFLTEVLDLDAGDRGSIPASLPGASTWTEAESDKLRARSRHGFWKVKRGLDACAALGILVLLSPVLLLVAFFVAASVGSPVVFWQRRPGRLGRPFHLYKFRTMGPSHAPDGSRLSDTHRISKFGGFMRRTRLDELPQLINILRGDMSFVGPRPLLPQDQPKACWARLLVRPGLTGWAQIVGGRAISPEDKAALDLWYVRHASLLLDLGIIARTVPIILFGERISEPLIERARRELIEAGIMSDEMRCRMEKQLRITSTVL
jgi:lipopolysaccharide/colanic/teichoic acid biosynthesis glycosyltransferase